MSETGKPLAKMAWRMTMRHLGWTGKGGAATTSSDAKTGHAGIRAGFTLVELLVVIMIIAMLAALVTPAVMRAQASARNAAIKAEIDMLHMAIMNYKNEYGSFPPCIDPTGGSSGAINMHIKRLFPRTITASLCSSPNNTYLTPATALVAWLSGFTSEPQDPLAIATPTSPRTKLYSFDQSRQTTALTSAFPYGTGYYPSQKPESIYVYFPNSFYVGGVWPTSSVTYSAGSQSFTIPANAYRPWSYNGSYFNPDSFQIICAGRDGILSEDSNMNGALDAGEDVNSNGSLDNSDDDLSNFWPGTRKDYLDSLK